MKKVNACATPSIALNHSQVIAPTVGPGGTIIPQSTPLMNGLIKNSSRDFGKRGSATPAEAIAANPTNKR